MIVVYNVYIKTKILEGQSKESMYTEDFVDYLKKRNICLKIRQRRTTETSRNS